MAGVAANFLSLELLTDEPGCVVVARTDEEPDVERVFPAGEKVSRAMFELGAAHDHKIVDEIADRLGRERHPFAQEVYDRAKGLIRNGWEHLVEVARDLEQRKAYYGTEGMVAVRAMRNHDAGWKAKLDTYRTSRCKNMDPPEGWKEAAHDLPWHEPMQDWLDDTV